MAVEQLLNVRNTEVPSKLPLITYTNSHTLEPLTLGLTGAWARLGVRAPIGVDEGTPQCPALALADRVLQDSKRRDIDAAHFLLMVQGCALIVGEALQAMGLDVMEMFLIRRGSISLTLLCDRFRFWWSTCDLSWAPSTIHEDQGIQLQC